MVTQLLTELRDEHAGVLEAIRREQEAQAEANRQRLIQTTPSRVLLGVPPQPLGAGIPVRVA